jgi:hypothetical protein
MTKYVYNLTSFISHTLSYRIYTIRLCRVRIYNGLPHRNDESAVFLDKSSLESWNHFMTSHFPFISLVSIIFVSTKREKKIISDLFLFSPFLERIDGSARDFVWQ